MFCHLPRRAVPGHAPSTISPAISLSLAGCSDSVSPSAPTHWSVCGASTVVRCPSIRPLLPRCLPIQRCTGRLNYQFLMFETFPGCKPVKRQRLQTRKISCFSVISDGPTVNHHQCREGHFAVVCKRPSKARPRPRHQSWKKGGSRFSAGRFSAMLLSASHSARGV